MRALGLILGAFLLLAGCASAPSPAPPAAVSETRLNLVDPSRQRSVPVLLYRPSDAGPHPLAVLSHGYGGNPEDYSFIASRLGERGWLVAAIDHELPSDPPIPTTGEPRVVRMPNWRIGADSIGFVIENLRIQGLAGPSPVLLVGHSNGGDMDMLFAADHPAGIAAVISLDNRRMPLPVAGSAPILTLRSSDQTADAGVLPEPAARAASRITVVPVAVRHDDMWDGASPAQKAEMLAAIERFLDAEGF